MIRRLPVPLGVEHALLGGAALALGLLAGIDPVLAVAAALGLAFVLIVMVDITAGLCLFAVLIFLDQVPLLGGTAATFTKGAGLVLAMSWLAYISTHGARGRNFMAEHGIFTLVLGAFLAWAALSLLWAESIADGAESVLRYSLNVLLFLIVFTAVGSRQRALSVIVALVAAATLSALYGLVVPAEVDEGEGLTRFGGSVGEPNEFAALIVAALMLLAALAGGARKSPGLRMVAVAAAVLCTVTVFLTLSRGGLVALAVGLVVAVAVAGRWRGVAAVLAIVVGFSAVLFYTTLASPDARERVTFVEGGSGRTDIWTVAWRMVEDEPLRGIGTGNFQRASIHYLLEPGAIERDEFIVDTPKVAHNIYLQVLAELGAVGLVLFLAVLAFPLACAFKAARRFNAAGDGQMAIMAYGVFIALIALLAAYFFVSEQHSKQMWLLLGLGPSLLAVASRASSEPSETHLRGA